MSDEKPVFRPRWSLAAVGALAWIVIIAVIIVVIRQS